VSDCAAPAQSDSDTIALRAIEDNFNSASWLYPTSAIGPMFQVTNAMDGISDLIENKIDEGEAAKDTPPRAALPTRRHAVPGGEGRELPRRAQDGLVCERSER
jgi:hypothetical protein